MRTKLFLSSLFIASSSAFAGGLDLAEYGTPSSVGTAGVGNLTNTRDATIAMTNPAGMSQIEGDLFSTSVQFLTLDARFEDKGSTNSGGNGGQLGSTEIMPASYFVSQINDQWHWGIGLNSHTGLGMDYNDSWVGRYSIQEVSIATLQLNPSLSYKVNDKLSVGAGLVIDYAMLFIEAGVPKIGSGEGSVEIEDAHAALGYNLGLMYQATPATRLALTYQSEIEHRFKDHPKHKGTGPLAGALLSNVNMDMTMPQMVKAALRHELTEKTAILLSASWKEWSKFGEIPVQIRNADRNANRNYNDTWGGGIAFEHKLNDKWLLMSGYNYDSSIVDNKHRTADLPSADMHRFGFGAEYEWAENITVGGAYEFVDMGTPGINQTSASATTVGEYDNALHFVTVGLTYRF